MKKLIILALGIISTANAAFEVPQRVGLAEQSHVRTKWSQDWTLRPDTMQSFLANPYMMQQDTVSSSTRFRNAFYRHTKINPNILKGKAKQRML